MQINASKFSAVIAMSVLPSLVVDINDGTILAANENANRLLDETSLVGRNFTRYAGESLKELLVFTEAVRHFRESWTRNVQLKTGQDNSISLEIHGRMLEMGEQSVLLLQMIDLNAYEARTQKVLTSDLHAKGLMEWKRAREFFREMESENRLILDAAGEGIYGVNAKGKTTFVNNAAEQMLGWTAEDLIGQDIHAMIHHHHLDGELYHSRDCPIYQTFRNEQVNRVEDEVFWRKDGKPIQVEYVSTPIYDEQILAGAVVIFRDITERRENEKKLRAAMTEVDALKTRLEQENEYLREEIRSVRSHYDLVGSSLAINRTLAQIDLVAQTETNVLITGEGGTGKALVASAIHKSGPRSNRPIIRINCAGIPATSFESELFGHVRGAFSGALHDRTGKLEIANGGTLFLEEVSEIPMELQGKILKSLQEKTLERLGENRVHKINLRVIASSSRDLEKCVEEGSFRKDFYFFLNVFPIECPPLRDHLEDLPELVKHFLKLACEKLNLPLPTVTKRNMQTLQQYAWPGNVRELQNIIERGAILSGGNKLVLDLPETAQSLPGVSDREVLTEEQMKAFQIENIAACMRMTAGRVSGEDGAAKLLGIKPTTLYSRIKKLNISPDLWA